MTTNNMSSRQEHIDFCKTRAREYLQQGDLSQAVASMLSDLNKHPETAEAGVMMAPLGMLAMMREDREGVKKFIEGFN